MTCVYITDEEGNNNDKSDVFSEPNSGSEEEGLVKHVLLDFLFFSDDEIILF